VEAERESPLWRDALRSAPEPEPVFSPLGEERYALGLETIYEGYLTHYGTPRLFAPVDADTGLLLGLLAILAALWFGLLSLPLLGLFPLSPSLRRPFPLSRPRHRRRRLLRSSLPHRP